MSDPYAQRPADEPPSQPFQPMSYDLAPEFTPPPADPASPTSAGPAYPTSGSPGGVGQGPYGPPQSYPAPAAPPGPFPGPFVPPPVVGGFAPAPVAPAPRKRRGLAIGLSVIGGVLVLCGVLSCVYGYPLISESSATVTAPSELPGGLTKDTSDSMQQTADSVESQLKSDIGATQAVAGFYNDSEGHQVLVVAATTLILFPASEVNNAFTGIREGSIQIDNVSEHDAGKLGGTVKCGTGKASSLDMTACVWADHGSAGIVFFFERGLSESAELFLQIREAVEKR